VPAENSERFAATDRALTVLDKIQQKSAGAGEALRPLVLESRFDRLVALRNRSRMRDVVAEYDQLHQEGAVLPPRALIAAGDALLYRQEPERARDAYHQALTADPGNLTAQLGLFYSYVELDEISRALALIDLVASDRPAWLQRTGRTEAIANPEKLEAEIAAALARVYAEDLAEAQQRFETMLMAAPYNRDLYRELGNVYAARGWPRRAAEIYRQGLGLEPRHRGLRVGLAGTFLDRRQFHLAGPAIAELAEEFPEDREVQRLGQWWEIHNRPELRLEASRGWNDGVELGSREFTLAAAL
jgi:biofilm PGA synthesis protein PgaA